MPRILEDGKPEFRDLMDVPVGSLVQFIDGDEAIVLSNNFPCLIRYCGNYETAVENWSARVLKLPEDMNNEQSTESL